MHEACLFSAHTHTQHTHNTQLTINNNGKVDVSDSNRVDDHQCVSSLIRNHHKRYHEGEIT